MRDEYDFSGGIKNPYVRQQKTTVTIRLDTATVDYFKKLINLCKQMNYAEFKSGKFEDYKRQIRAMVEEKQQ